MKNNYLFITITVVSLIVLMSFNQTKVDEGYLVEPNPKFQNLQVLPKDISDEDLGDLMDSFNESLGVRCSFCHVRGDDGKMNFASDHNIQKEVAREMMRMTQIINQEFFNENIPTNYIVTCYTCHKSEKKPSKTVTFERE